LVKVKQYAEVVKENDKALAKKRERKAAEAAEQERLFKIQNDMYDKQVSSFRAKLTTPLES
jgi:peptide subunit release factor 1 (eRF1)